MYEAEGWQRVGSVALPVAADRVLDLWVYVSPDLH